MTRKVFCLKLQKEADGLAFPPFPNELGKKIFDTISQEAWNLWLQQQTMLINEYRLNLMEKEAREILLKEMKKFLLGEES